MTRQGTAMSTSTRNSVLIYACAFAVAGGVPFVLLPILTRALSPQQFGEVTAFLMLTALLTSFAGLSATSFVSVRYFKVPKDQFRVLVSSSMMAVAAAHGVAAVAVGLMFPLLSRSLDLPFSMAMLAVAAALFLNFNLIFLGIFQSSGQPLLYLRARLIQGGCELVICLALIRWVAADASARIDSYTIAIVASALVGWWVCLRRQQVGGGIERQYLKGLFRFGMPMLPHIVAGTAIAYVDRLVITSLMGAQNLGLYMVAMQIGMAMVAMIEPLNKALAPWLFAQLTKNDAAVRALVVKRTYQLYAALALLGVMVAVLAHLLFDHFIGASFAAAKVLVPWMVAGFVLQGMYYSVVNYVFFAEWSGRLSMVTGTTAVVGCLVSYVLTSRFGLIGASVSFAFNNALLFVLVWWTAARAVPMPWFSWSR